MTNEPEAAADAVPPPPAAPPPNERPSAAAAANDVGGSWLPPWSWGWNTSDRAVAVREAPSPAGDPATEASTLEEDAPEAGAAEAEAALVCVEPQGESALDRPAAAASYYDWFSRWFGYAAPAESKASVDDPSCGEPPVFAAELAAPASDGAAPAPDAPAEAPEIVVEAVPAERVSGALVVVSPSSGADAVLQAGALLHAGALQVGAAGAAAVDVVRASVVAAVVAGIRLVSSERDRDEILRWFVNARGVLAKEGTTAQTAAALYGSIDTLRFAQLLGNTLATSVSNYRGSNLPLSLKVALPAAMVGAALFGMKGAGLAAFGGGIGMPVVLLIFLGTAGATSVLEAFVMDRSVRDPLTKLLLAFAAFEAARKAKKDFLDAMRADAMVPERAATPNDSAAVLEFLLAMDPVAFERHVMSFFESEGHPTGLTARSNDFGVDGYVFHPDGLIVVQCKRYAVDHPVGRPDVQQFKGVVEEQRAYRGYFVTTSRFTAGAVDSAAQNDRLRLVDGDLLLRWHREGFSGARSGPLEPAPQPEPARQPEPAPHA